MKRVEFKENVRALSPQGQSKLPLIMSCPSVLGGCESVRRGSTV